MPLQTRLNSIFFKQGTLERLLIRICIYLGILHLLSYKTATRKKTDRNLWVAIKISGKRFLFTKTNLGKYTFLKSFTELYCTNTVTSTNVQIYQIFSNSVQYNTTTHLNHVLRIRCMLIMKKHSRFEKVVKVKWRTRDKW